MPSNVLWSKRMFALAIEAIVSTRVMSVNEEFTNATLRAPFR